MSSSNGKEKSVSNFEANLSMNRQNYIRDCLTVTVGTMYEFTTMEGKKCFEANLSMSRQNYIRDCLTGTVSRNDVRVQAMKHRKEKSGSKPICQ
jgi:hypothetical protein